MTIGNLWEKEKNGLKYLSGVIHLPPFGSLQITVFPEEYEMGKPNPGAPDFNIVWNPSPRKRQEERKSGEAENVPF